MITIDKIKLKPYGAPVARQSAALSGFGSRFRKALEGLFQPHPDPGRLNARLRRDVGMDELELERDSVVKAPWIR